jgi:hypothetical protein
LDVNAVVRLWREQLAHDVDGLSVPSLHASMGADQFHEDNHTLQPTVVATHEVGRGQESVGRQKETVNISILMIYNKQV